MSELATALAGAVDPVALARRAGIEPDPWQQRALRSTAGQQLWLCCRQAGKSLTAAILAVHTAATTPGATVLLVSPSQRQSTELMHAVKGVLRYMDRPTQEAETKVTLANGSRIISLPGTEGTIRGYSAHLLVIDEAAQVPDDTYAAVRPMLAVTNGRLVALTTPHGARGWFHDAWRDGSGWERTRVPATDVPRISAAFLADERAALGERTYKQEYELEWMESAGSLWRADQIERMFDGGW
ncbi:MAG: terminase family protein [Actinobacteria bacterium]|nr:terminase family protein [Actinomycetota bacterium]